MARCAITSGLALMLAVFAGWLLLSAVLTGPPARVDSAGIASDIELQRDVIAAKHAVAEAFPQIEQFGGLRPDPRHAHDEGLALDILILGNPASGEGIALGDAIRDLPLTRADELGIDHVLWRQHVYRADGTSAPMETRGSDVADHVTLLHVMTKGGGHP